MTSKEELKYALRSMLDDYVTVVANSWQCSGARFDKQFDELIEELEDYYNLTGGHECLDYVR